MTDRNQPDESVMAGHGYYSAHSRPQHAAAAVAYPLLAAAAECIPTPVVPTPFAIGDLGCAGGANEVGPMAIAIDSLRARDWHGPVEVVHTDLPENDFAPLFELLSGPSSYLANRTQVYPSVIGRTLYGPLFPDRRLHLAWSGITLHWLSSVPGTVPDAVYPNLTTGPHRDALARRSAEDWRGFLIERSRELVDGGEIVVVAGASAADGTSGAERLFTTIDEVLGEMAEQGAVRRAELERIFYPTWNRTMDEWLAPFATEEVGRDLEVVEHRFDASDDSDTFPQYARDADAAGFARAYVPFVRAVTAAPFFRWLGDDRSPSERDVVITDFYDRLELSLTADPTVAAVWHVASLRIRRRSRNP